MRSRLIDFQLSRGAQAAGLCQGDVASVASVANEAQQRLLFAGGEHGWYGSWFRMAFNVTQATPYVTPPREVARLINIAVCKHPVRVQNGFYEFLEAGYGVQPKTCGCNFLEAYERNNVVSSVEMTSTNKKLRFYISDDSDIGKRVLVQGLDANGMRIYSRDGLVQVEGVFLDLTSPFVDMDRVLSVWDGFQKDFTVGTLSVYEVDQTTGAQTLLSIYQPGEQVASYRRYFINGLPHNCCDPTDEDNTTVQVEAMARLEFIPVAVGTDYLTIQNIPALIEEVQSLRYSGADTPQAKQFSILHHNKAIRLLNGELEFYEGKQQPAINFAPFGTARLRHQGIGQLI